MALETDWPLASIRHLRCFLLAAEASSIGRAAEEIRMSQPAASYAISRLESLFGASLLIRSPGGSVLSPAGERLQVRAARFFDLLAEGLSSLGVDESRRTRLLGTLRKVHIRGLVAVAESGTFTSAARQLNVSGPALHRVVRELEKLVRCQLFQVHANGIGVNAAGETLARQFRLATQEMVQAREEIGRYNAGSVAKINLGVLPLLPKRWIARVIARARQNYPDVAIELREGHQAVLVQELRWGDLDLIVGALPPSSSGADIVQQPLFSDPYVLVVRRGHPLAGKRTLKRHMLTTFDWVAPSQTMPRRAALERFFDTLPSRPRIWLDTSSPGTVMAVVEETECITLLSRTQLLTDGAPNLAVLPVKIADRGRKVGITSRRNWLPTPAQRNFLKALAQTPPLGNAE